MNEENNTDRKAADYAFMMYILQKVTLTFEEAIFYLGFSGSYMYKLTAARKIPHYCPCGKLIFFNRLELDAWVFSGKRATIEEIEIESKGNKKRKQ